MPSTYNESTSRSAATGRSGRSILNWISWIGWREVSVLLVIVALSGSLWGFAELLDETQEGSTEDFDRELLLSMRNPSDLTDPIGPGWVEEMGRDFTALGGISVLTVTTLAVLGYLMMHRRKRLALVVLVATLGALVVSTVLKHTIDRPRPDLVPHGSIVYTASFPSGHSMQAAATYLTLGALLARVERRRRAKAYILTIATLITLLVGASRVYLGVHWPTDVLAGWTAGATWALLCWLLALWLQRRGQLEQQIVDEGAKESEISNVYPAAARDESQTERQSSVPADV